MSDEKLRELERRWKETGDNHDLEAWLHAFRRAAPSFLHRVRTEWCYYNGTLTQPDSIDITRLRPTDCIIFTDSPCPTGCYFGDGRLQGLPNEPPEYESAVEALAQELGVAPEEVQGMRGTLAEIRGRSAEQAALRAQRAEDRDRRIVEIPIELLEEFVASSEIEEINEDQPDEGAGDESDVRP